MISFNCPSCGTKLEIPEQYAGQSGKCRQCQTTILVPSIASDVSHTPPPLTELMSNADQEATDKHLSAFKKKKIPCLGCFGIGLLFFIILIVIGSLANNKAKVSQTSNAVSIATNAPKVNMEDALINQPVEPSGITCDTFKIDAELKGDTLLFHLETDLPDSAEIWVGVRRSYFEKGDEGTAYAIEYFSKKSKVLDWRKDNTCSVADSIFMKSLQDKMNEMASLSMPFEVANISDEIDVSFTLPVVQSDRAFGEQNINLHGAMVPLAGIKAIQTVKNINKPLSQTTSGMPKAVTASFDTLEVDASYRVSRETPLMPEYDPVDPLSAIARKISIPVSSTILIKEKKDNDGDLWYRAQAYGLGDSYIGEGWINSIALMGQDLSKVE